MTVSVQITSVLNRFFLVYSTSCGTMFSLTLLCQVFVFTVYSSHLSLLFPRRSGLVDVCMNKESTFISRLEEKGRTNRD